MHKNRPFFAYWAPTKMSVKTEIFIKGGWGARRPPASAKKSRNSWHKDRKGRFSKTGEGGGRTWWLCGGNTQNMTFSGPNFVLNNFKLDKKTKYNYKTSFGDQIEHKKPSVGDQILPSDAKTRPKSIIYVP